MSPRWLFFPTPAATGFLQETTWTMTGASTATISSTGQDIINQNYTSLLSWAPGKPRLINGAEASNSGATGSGGRYFFGTGTLSRAWWDNYIVEMEKNGGGFVSLGDPVYGSTQSWYLNSSSTSIPGFGTAFVSGDIIKFRVSNAT